MAKHSHKTKHIVQKNRLATYASLLLMIVGLTIRLLQTLYTLPYCKSFLEPIIPCLSSWLFICKILAVITFAISYFSIVRDLVFKKIGFKFVIQTRGIAALVSVITLFCFVEESTLSELFSAFMLSIVGGFASSFVYSIFNSDGRLTQKAMKLWDPSYAETVSENPSFVSNVEIEPVYELKNRSILKKHNTSVNKSGTKRNRNRKK